MTAEFIRELTAVINRHSRETAANSADFILGQYINDCLQVYWNTLARQKSSGDKKSVAAKKNPVVQAFTALVTIIQQYNTVKQFDVEAVALQLWGRLISAGYKIIDGAAVDDEPSPELIEHIEHHRSDLHKLITDWLKTPESPVPEWLAAAIADKILAEWHKFACYVVKFPTAKKADADAADNNADADNNDNNNANNNNNAGAENPVELIPAADPLEIAGDVLNQAFAEYCTRAGKTWSGSSLPKFPILATSEHLLQAWQRAGFYLVQTAPDNLAAVRSGRYYTLVKNSACFLGSANRVQPFAIACQVLEEYQKFYSLPTIDMVQVATSIMVKLHMANLYPMKAQLAAEPDPESKIQAQQIIYQQLQEIHLQEFHLAEQICRVLSERLPQVWEYHGYYLTSLAEIPWDADNADNADDNNKPGNTENAVIEATKQNTAEPEAVVDKNIAKDIASNASKIANLVGAVKFELNRQFPARDNRQLTASIVSQLPLKYYIHHAPDTQPLLSEVMPEELYHIIQNALADAADLPIIKSTVVKQMTDNILHCWLANGYRMHKRGSVRATPSVRVRNHPYRI